MRKSFVMVVMGLALAMSSCNKCSRSGDGPAVEGAGGSPAAPQSMLVETLKPGAGTAKVVLGSKVKVHYTSKLADGKVVDSSETRATPFEFTVGAGQVIAGWDKGVVGMLVGERRRLTIPADLAYGEKGVENVIPANSTIVLEVELLGIE